jgi:hypothetical protein
MMHFIKSVDELLMMHETEISTIVIADLKRDQAALKDKRVYTN